HPRGPPGGRTRPRSTRSQPMNTLVVATSEGDAAAVEAVRNHHAQLAAGLGTCAEALTRAAATGSTETVAEARRALVSYCEHEVVPHALAEERAMYPLAHRDDRARMLVEA